MHCASIVLALLAALRAGGYEFSHIFSRFASTSNDSNASTIIVLFTQSISYRVWVNVVTDVAELLRMFFPGTHISLFQT